MESETTPEGYIVEKCGEAEAEEKNPEIFRFAKRMQIEPKIRNSPEKIEENRGFWRRIFEEKKITKVAAPMVDQSELAFRVLVRKYGAQLTYTPMIHAHLFVTDGTYRRNSMALIEKDRPIIVQFCANKVDTFLSACRLVEGHCDGVDLNLGCPQMVAKRGRYGSWLQDEIELICDMVEAVRDFCQLPISCKIRVRESREETVKYAKRLVEAGASMLTVHGRFREMKGAKTGLADWTRIRDVVDAIQKPYGIPIVANGNIQFPGDVERCIESTGAIAVMSAEGLLYNPLIFRDAGPCHVETWKIAKEYLELAKMYSAGASAMRAHVFRICHHSLLEYEDLRMRVSLEHRCEDFQKIVEELGRRCEIERESVEGAERQRKAMELFEGIRLGTSPMDPLEVSKQPHWISKPYFRLSEVAKESITQNGEQTFREKQKQKLAETAQAQGISMKKARKRERRQLCGKRVLEIKRAKFPPCSRCAQPAGQNCSLERCKKCCRFKCKHEKLDCKAHRYIFSENAEIAENC